MKKRRTINPLCLFNKNLLSSTVIGSSTNNILCTKVTFYCVNTSNPISVPLLSCMGPQNSNPFQPIVVLLRFFFKIHKKSEIINSS